MSKDDDGSIRHATSGGLAGSHPVLPVHETYVGPTTEAHSNRIIAALIPIACWRVDDLRFAYDSSLIRPEMGKEIGNLFELRDRHKLQLNAGTPGEPAAFLYPPLSIFGHADPAGQDEYNKTLSGRRATAVYALLVRDAALWEELYSRPMVGGGDSWGLKSVQLMLHTLGYEPGSDDGKMNETTDDAIRRFQRDQRMKVDGQAGPQTREKLFLAYMDRIGGGPSGKLDREQDFLARGQDRAGKGDYQGCGEFNPVMLFSEREAEEYAKPQNKSLRDEENAPNRRVMILLFRPGSRVKAEKWPCPRAKESFAGCRKRFWSDGERRRTERRPDARREYEESRDTFACRFYDRLADRSPCETLQKRDLRTSVCVPYESKEIDLLIADGAGHEVSRVNGREALRTENLLTFELSTSAMPNPAQLTFLTPDGPQPHGGQFDPIQLRDAFHRGDLEEASRIFGTAHEDASASSAVEAPDSTAALTKVALREADASAPPTPVLRLEVIFNNPGHRLVKTIEIALSQIPPPASGSGNIPPKSRAQGQVVFELPSNPGDRLALEVKIPDPDNVPGGASHPPILNIMQILRVDGTPGDPKLVPISGEKAGLHPRLDLADIKGAKGLFRVTIDVTFLDLTERIKRIQPLFNNFINPSHALCKYRILEFTGGQPTTWALAMAPSITAAGVNANIFLFFRNEILQKNDNSDDLNYGHLTRYFVSATDEGSYIQGSGAGAALHEYPNYGWDHQVAKAGKPAMVFFPFPQITSFGQAAIPATGGNLLKKALLCLWAEKVIAVGSGTGPVLQRLAVGGFSSGTDDLINWCVMDKAGDIVDEVFFFDGKGSKQAMPNFVGWMAKKANRKLRLIGTAYSAVQFFGINKSLTGKDVLFKPGDFNFWFTNANYLKAHRSSFFRSPGAASTGDPKDATDPSSIFLESFKDMSGGGVNVADASIKLSWRDSAGRNHSGAATIIAPVEAASLVRFQGRFAAAARPVTTKADFDKVINMLTDSGDKGEPNTTLKLRHPWSIFGGEWGYTTKDGATVKPAAEFVSYLQICLLESGFS